MVSLLLVMVIVRGSIQRRMLVIREFMKYVSLQMDVSHAHSHYVHPLTLIQSPRPIFIC